MTITRQQLDMWEAETKTLREIISAQRGEIERLRAENERMMTFIQSLDGRYYGLMSSDGQSFLDEGYVVADDILKHGR